MAKTRITYFVMVLIFATGLWSILRIGSHLHGPPNVAGEWQIRWARAPADVNMPDRLGISQSGEFLTATLASTARNQSPVKLRGTLSKSSGGDPTAQLALSGSSPQWLMNGRLDPARQAFTGHLDAPVRCDWQARRALPGSPK